MVEMTDELRALWNERMVFTASHWWTSNYESAMARIEVQGPPEDAAACWWQGSEGVSVDLVGGSTWDCLVEPQSPDHARRCAFELLVLADLAEASLPRGGEG